jgi:t-SNARE complex subunit (syntaxin)
MTELKLVIEIPELEALMADVQQLLEDVRSLKTEVGSRLDNIDNVIEELRSQVAAGQVDQATVDQIASEVSSVRQSLASVNPEDPSGDDAAPAPADPPADAAPSA